MPCCRGPSAVRAKGCRLCPSSPTALRRCCTYLSAVLLTGLVLNASVARCQLLRTDRGCRFLVGGVAESWAATRTSARECVARRHDDARRSLGSPAGVGLSSWLRRLQGVDPPLRKAQACDRSSACECVGQRNQRGVQWALRRMSSHTTSATRIQNAKISGIPTPNMVAAYWRVTDSPEHRRKRVPDSGMRVCVGHRLARVTPETRATGTVDWLCYSCLRAGTKVPAVTLRQGTALCETCALGEGQSLTLPAEDLTLALIDGETGRVVYAPTPRSWPTFSLTPPDPHA